MAEGLALVLGRWLDRPGWGSLRRRVGSYLAEVRVGVPEPPHLRLETPSGKLLAAVEYVEDETVLECARRTHPGRRDIMLCGADMAPRDPAEEVGDIEVLVVVVRQETTDTEYLAMNNKLGELLWLVANGCGWGPYTSCDAAMHGHLELLQWAVAHGCPWHYDTSYYAARGGHLELLRWALSHGCPLHPETRGGADRERRTAVVKWLDAI